jgi:hypothetical protein
MGLFSRKTDIIYSTPRARDPKKLLIIILAVIIAAVVVAVISLTGKNKNGSGASDTLKSLGDNFTAAVVSGDTAKSYSYLSPRAQSFDSKLGWEARLISLKNFYTSAEYKSYEEVKQKTDTQEGEGILYYQAQSKKKGAYTFRINIIQKTSGKEFVDSFSVTPGEYNVKK